MLLEVKEYTNRGLDLSEEGLTQDVAPIPPIRGQVQGPTLITVKDKEGEKVIGQPQFSDFPGTLTLHIESNNSKDAKAAAIGHHNNNEVVIGLHGSNSNTKLQMNGMRSQNSRESLIPEENKERWHKILREVFFPFLIAGLGMVAAGLILDDVKDSVVFTNVPEFLVLVTPLLGLKGNLEMTLASRLSTHANLGHMDTIKNQWNICFGNLSLTQVQAIVVGFLASVVAMVMGFSFDGRFVISHSLLLCCTSILTAAVASFVLGILMVLVILLSRKYNLNPDNISTPIAAALGDVVTLSLLSYTGTVLYKEIDSKPWLCPSIIIAFLVVTPFWTWISYQNPFTRKVLITGWPPVLTAMLISSGGGMLLDVAESSFPRIALYQPVINGVGGNLVSVQASRMATALHRNCEPGQLPEDKSGVPSKIWLSPLSVFFRQGTHSVAARVLLSVVIPGHLIFTTVTYFVSSKDLEFSPLFLMTYLSAALIQVAFLLYVANIMVNWFWTRKIDPDTSTIPYLTSLGDLVGTALLFLAFEILYSGDSTT